jgi:hypothetical protein
MSLAVGTGRRQQNLQNNPTTAVASVATSTNSTSTCTDRNCDQCFGQQIHQIQPILHQTSHHHQLMELDLTPSKSASSKRVRRDRENQLLLENQSSGLTSSYGHVQPLNLSSQNGASNLYLGPSLSYSSNPLYNRKHSNSSSSSAQNGIFQMINNVYAQQQQAVQAQAVLYQSERLLLKEGQGPKGSGSDSGVCSENESDVSPSQTNHSIMNNSKSMSSSRKSLFNSNSAQNSNNNDIGSSSGGKKRIHFI